MMFQLRSRPPKREETNLKSDLIRLKAVSINEISYELNLGSNASYENVVK